MLDSLIAHVPVAGRGNRRIAQDLMGDVGSELSRSGLKIMLNACGSDAPE